MNRFFFNSFSKGYVDKQKNFDKKLVYSFSGSKIPNLKQLKYLNRFLNNKEKLILSVCLLVFAASFSFLSFSFIVKKIKIIPAFGGTYSEGLVGQPQYINPLYSFLNDSDDDIERLVFSSLFKRGANGKMEKDLVKDMAVSADGKVYSITLRDDALWHDGEKLTADDVIFTFLAIQNKEYRSPLTKKFAGIVIEKDDDYGVKFTLANPFFFLPEILDFGILPEHIWRDVPPASAIYADMNLKPIGSGPYKFVSLKKHKNGYILSYLLEENVNYYASRPFIEKINLSFYNNYDEAITALGEGKIDGMSYLPKGSEDKIIGVGSLNIHKLGWGGETGLFFNQRNGLLSKKEIRQALSYAVDKNKIIETIKDARVLNGPFLPESQANEAGNEMIFDLSRAQKVFIDAKWTLKDITKEDVAAATADSSSEDEAKAKKAQDIIAMGEGRWLVKDGEFLKIKISFLENSDEAIAAQIISDEWASIGIKVILVPLSNDKISEAIKNRNFEAVVYSIVPSGSEGVYSFWSSAQSESGSNFSGFKNDKADQLLSSARSAATEEERITLLKQFGTIIQDETPAVFLYSPYYFYPQAKNIKGFQNNIIFSPSDRFIGAEKWYIKTKKSIF